MQDKPRKLHGIDAIRVVAEYLVVRFHVLPEDKREGFHGPIGVDIMSFFFVLSGFVMMYTFERADFSTWQAVRQFWWDRLRRVYPVFLINWLCWIPYLVKVWDPDTKEGQCWLRKLCPLLQLVMLDGWAGCGVAFTANGVSWYLSCLMWLWLVFPLIKDALVDRFSRAGSVWAKMAWINLAWICIVCLFWPFDLYTISGLPFLRIGEFLIGCGVASALRLEAPGWLANGRHWIPFAGVVLFYCFQRVDHGLWFLCLHENAQHDGCSIWNAGQAWVENKPPCITVFEKIPNKYALVWAVLIHGVARAEIAGVKGGFLQAEVFKLLSSFSLALYLGHVNMYMAVVGIGRVLGWNKVDWRDDTVLILVYLLCYGMHSLMVAAYTRLQAGARQPLAGEEDIELLDLQAAKT